MMVLFEVWCRVDLTVAIALYIGFTFAVAQSRVKLRR